VPRPGPWAPTSEVLVLRARIEKSAGGSMKTRSKFGIRISIIQV